jgi:hypothetical protein
VGRSLYYHVFRFILTGKEMMRYYVKVLALKLFNVRIR